jgi:hypothetical protein
VSVHPQGITEAAGHACCHREETVETTALYWDITTQEPQTLAAHDKMSHQSRAQLQHAAYARVHWLQLSPYADLLCLVWDATFSTVAAKEVNWQGCCSIARILEIPTLKNHLNGYPLKYLACRAQAKYMHEFSKDLAHATYVQRFRTVPFQEPDSLK